VDKAWEEGDQIKYQTSQGINTIPRNRVQKIQQQRHVDSPETRTKKYGFGVESGEAAASATRNPIAIPLNVPSKDVSDETILRLKENLKANPDDVQLKRGLVQALNSYASLQLLRGDPSGAKNSLEQALVYDKTNPTTLLNLAILFYQTAEYRSSEELLSGLVQKDSRSHYGHYLLGEVYYAQDKTREAIAEWKIALQLGDDPVISSRLKKAEDEQGIHNELGVLHSAHFILRYDRKVSDYRLGQDTLDALEQAYRQLSYDLTSDPPATVTVILYADQAYFDITRAPRWSGALFDGKIRIPIKGIPKVTPELDGVLVHELTHSFVNALSHGNCPIWFNEGLAQLQEGRSAAEYRKLLSQLQNQNRLLPLSRLKGSFVGFSAGEAEVAYVEGLSAAEYFIARSGKTGIRMLLDLLRQNYSFENALKSATNQSESEFEKSWLTSLSE